MTTPKGSAAEEVCLYHGSFLSRSEGRTDAVVSAGNSGATRGAAVLILEG